MLYGGRGSPVEESVGDDPVGPRGLVGTHGGHELREGRGEAIEGLPVIVLNSRL